MKTSVIEVRAMLSVWSVDEVEKRLGEVPGVESVTVNFAAGSATVRYDETRLGIADIRSAVRQSGYESAAASADKGHEGRAASGAPSATPAPASPKTTAVLPASTGADSAGAAQADKAAPSAAASAPSAAAFKPSPTAPTPAAPKPTAAAGEKPQDTTASDKS